MRIGGVSGMGTGMQPGMAQGVDAEGRNLQKQIQEKQQELQKLSENADMSREEKMKKRQQLQQEIADLNMQLRQHRMDQRKEQKSKGAAAEEAGSGKQAAASKPKGRQDTGLSQASMRAMISADSSMKQAGGQGSVAQRMEGRIGVLQAEIKLDSALGGDTSRKEEELARTEQKASDAEVAQMSTLGKVNRDVKEAAEENKDTEKADRKAEDEEKERSRIEDGGKSEKENLEKEKREKESAGHVDVRL